MTTNVFSSGAFWGVVIVLIGVGLILREVFHINFPFLRLLFGLLLIYWGVKIIYDGFGKPTRRDHEMFSNDSHAYDGSRRDYNIVFGNSTIDFFKMEEPVADSRCEVSAVFGNAIVLINENLPVKVKMDAAFGQVIAPGKSVSGFGENEYTTSSYDPSKPALVIEADAVFGKVEIRSRKW